MLILRRTDGTRIAIETSLISALEETNEGKAPTVIYCGNHHHTVEMTLNETIDIIDKYENEEDEPESDSGLHLVETKQTEAQAT